MTWNNVGDDWPPTIEGWDECITAAGLHIKWSPQLREIHDLWVAKLPRIELVLMEEQVSSNLKIKYNADGTFEPIDRTQERLDNIAQCERKIKRGNAVIRLCIEEERIRKALEAKGQVFKVPKQYERDGSRLDVSDKETLILPESLTRSPIGTTYYIDADSGSDGNAGTSTGAAWATFAKYTTTTTRSAGDIAICRRGMTATYAASDTALNFDDDGTATNPIVLKADNANAFGDDVDLSATATATITFGSVTITFASDISSVLAAGDVIYEANDDADLYAYEVLSVSTVTVTLKLPYKGLNAGSGKTMTNMGSNPVYGALTDTASGFITTGDDYWTIQGVHLKTNLGLAFIVSSFGSCLGLQLVDFVLEQGTATSGAGVSMSYTIGDLVMKKTIIENFTFAIYCTSAATRVDMYDCLIDGNSKSGSKGLSLSSDQTFNISDSEFKDNSSGDIDIWGRSVINVRLRNTLLSSTPKFDASIGSGLTASLPMEDYQQTPSDTRVFTRLDNVDDEVITQSETTTVRSGGSNVSIKVIPTTLLGEIVLLDIPIKHDTSATTYTIHVKSNATTDWTTDPTANQLELSFEAWGHATNNHRKMNLSTDVADFNGVTTWETLAVTVTAAQAGTGYLRLKYRKPKESTKTNEFYVDPIPLFS